MMCTCLSLSFSVSLSQQATAVGQELHQLTQSLTLLKEESAKEGRVVEMAQRTRELPTGLQHENNAPDQ